MLITILVFSISTFLFVGVVLLFNYKTAQKMLSTFAEHEKSTYGLIENSKKELLDKIENLIGEVASKLESAKSEMQTDVKQQTDLLLKEIAIKAQESNVSNQNIVTTAKTSLFETLEPIIKNAALEINANLERLAADGNIKIESSLRAQEQRQHELSNEIKLKFDAVIDEIKTPLTID